MKNRRSAYPLQLTLSASSLLLYTLLFCGVPACSGQSAIAAPAQAQAPAPAATPALAPAAAPAPAQDLTGCMSELKETVRRMKGDNGDILHEVTRTESVMPNGVAEDRYTNGIPPQIQGLAMTDMDAMSHDVYLPARPHWLNNSLAQLLDLQSKLQAETAILAKILASPECNSGARAQGMVLGDISTEVGKDLGALEVLIRATPPKNADINLAAHKIDETLSGMGKVCDRLWKEAPRKLKSR